MAHKTTIATKEKNERLYRAILALETEEECYAFFQDLCTIAELRSMEQRYEVATLLSEGMVYSDILERTGASSATISRVNRALLNGTGGYVSVLGKMKEDGHERYEGLRRPTMPDHRRSYEKRRTFWKSSSAAAVSPSTRCWIWPAAPAP
ncbi:MAG: YerC/YecD family TrpR-related protein [Oscillospiraceae bacterium]